MIVAIYLAAIVLANVAISALGASWSPVIGFFFIGLDLTLRDKLHEQWRGDRLFLKMANLIVWGGLLSVLVQPAAGDVAIASCLTFILSSAADAWMYTRMRHRGKALARYSSNIVGALVDSMVFIPMAFGVLLPAVMLAQFLAKGAGGMLWAWLFNWKERG
jgi:hypothetical protein